jgi:hypothetical protein
VSPGHRRFAQIADENRFILYRVDPPLSRVSVTRQFEFRQ